MDNQTAFLPVHRFNFIVLLRKRLNRRQDRRAIRKFEFMKRTILAAFLILTVGAFVSFAQTKKRTARGKSSSATAATKRAVVKKPAAATATTKKMTNSAAMTTESGLTYIVTKRGDGAQLKAGDNVVVHYTGLLTNGQKFDSSLDRGEPFSFPLGAGRVIKGWDEGVQKLRVGDHATFIIPASIAYGSRGAGGVIPPDATLIFIIEVVGVK
jgi:FKBP-type peptidyl-prolyl cis-trans isomerase